MNAWVWSCGGGDTAGAAAECQYFQAVMRIGMNIRSALVLSIFRKATTLNPTARGGYSSGRIANMIRWDVAMRCCWHRLRVLVRTCVVSHG